MRIQDAYENIRASYSSKKQHPWIDLLRELPSLSEERPGILIDVGGGNGRNLQKCSRTLVIALDITRALLEDYVGGHDHQRIEGSLPNLPFRKCAAEEVLSIAVVHHLRSNEERRSAVHEMVRILDGTLVFTVWRKWRESNARKILQEIRTGGDPWKFVDHERPWKDSRGNVLTHRFYHYFSRRELITILGNLDYSISTMGGKSKADNFLVNVLSRCRNHSLLN